MIYRFLFVIRGLLPLVLITHFSPDSIGRSAGVWGSRPLVSYFALTASLENQLRFGANLNPSDFQIVESIAHHEAESLSRLFNLSLEITADPTLSIAEKRYRIAAMRYNQRVDGIVYQTDQLLRQSLSRDTYKRLVHWIELRWPIERMLHGIPDPYVVSAASGAVRSFEVFATRYESKGGAYTVALPDKCLKLSNGGLHTCDHQGYAAGSGYSVAISYKQGVGVVVGEAGPWNIDDNFWASAADPQPRRMFIDLPVGMPEAQAAYFNGYNGGTDQYGRKVTGPFAIDLAFQVGDDIGLPPKKNDWIAVSFLWTADWSSKTNHPGAQPGSTPGQLEPTSNFIPVVQTQQPAADGSIIHIVKGGETLWSIAMAYHVQVAQLQLLNGLGQTIVIYEGQRLRIKEAGPTWTPGTELASTTDQTLVPDLTPSSISSYQVTEKQAGVEGTSSKELSSDTSPSITPMLKNTPVETLSMTSTPENFRPKKSEKSGIQLSENDFLIGALILAGSGILLFGLGWLFARKDNKNQQ